jgi:hypothetical protein
MIKFLPVKMVTRNQLVAVLAIAGLIGIMCSASFLPMLPSAAHAQSNSFLCMNDKSSNQSVCSNGQTTCLFDKNVPVRCMPDVSSPLG